MMQPRESVPLPKETNSSASPLVMEVQHKPGSKSFSYKELRGDATAAYAVKLHFQSSLADLVCLSYMQNFA